ncbi:MULTISPECIES: hypothetical protein [unclassified Streptomyces]|uniref:hypothetical protein n=1 Tax=unclassified Streptomyces TaxID=2593676 RepID=UPI002237AC1E|nr:hypothetical protein [Streptomyces sp. SHP 1-2]
MADFEKRLACVIAADGSVVRGYLIEGCRFDGTNSYVLQWGVPLFGGEAKTNFAVTVGSAEREAVEPGLVTVTIGPESNEVTVHTFDPRGTPSPRPFHIACFRDR